MRSHLFIIKKSNQNQYWTRSCEHCGDNDWCFQPLNGVDASTVPMKDPKEIDLYCQMRDGMFENEQMFLVWEYDDVIQLINRLRETI